MNRLLGAIVGYSASMANRERKKSALKLSRQEGFAVNALGQLERVTMSHLSTQLGCSMSNLTLLVDRLVKQDIVVRIPSTEDRRVVLVKLTKKGEALYAEYLTNHLQLAHSMLAPLSATDRAHLVRILELILTSLQD